MNTGKNDAELILGCDKKVTKSMWRIMKCNDCGGIFSLPIDLIDKKDIVVVCCPLCKKGMRISDHFAAAMEGNCEVVERSEWSIKLP